MPGQGPGRAGLADRFRDGQLVESSIIMDLIGLLTQIGAIPAQAATGPTTDVTR